VYRRVFPIRARVQARERALDRRALAVGLGAITLFLVLLLGGEPLGLPAWVAGALPHAFTPLGAGGVKGFAAGVVSANLLNNLPALLVGLTHVSAPARVWPLLLGVNFGPLLLLTGSLAGLLWQSGARRAGVYIDARKYARVGAAVGLPAMVAAAVVLRVLG
jgi:Na+/H+ antiporter NhaD/arsenite permease-like protein